ncbi:serine protease easter-like [Contarinia nasturtii]|uniref:serine protease easter-like n=1 Tax=Contarinia nasturtii TaxID=265458 RepID=UPI0012D3EE4C|nr:serine protease easter-like [Contarinia nasturtii]
MYGLKSDECQKTHSNITSKQFCAYNENGQRPCHGDEGGPLLGQDLTDLEHPFLYLAGIVSIVNQNCNTLNIPSVYTKVDQHLNWMLSKMSK